MVLYWLGGRSKIYRISFTFWNSKGDAYSAGWRLSVFSSFWTDDDRLHIIDILSRTEVRSYGSWTLERLLKLTLLQSVRFRSLHWTWEFLDSGWVWCFLTAAGNTVQFRNLHCIWSFVPGTLDEFGVCYAGRQLFYFIGFGSSVYELISLPLIIVSRRERLCVLDYCRPSSTAMPLWSCQCAAHGEAVRQSNCS